MTGEKFLENYIVRVSDRGGRPRIAVLNVGSGIIVTLDSFSELTEHLERSRTAKPSPAEPPSPRQGGNE